MPEQLPDNRGFTLVEVMVALTVTALLLTSVYQTVNTASRAREKLAVENTRHHMARIATERIGRELQSLHFNAADSRTRFRGGITGGDMELLSFSSTASTPLARVPGVPARISYRLELDRDEEEELYTLERVESSLLSDDEGRAYKLAEDISEMEISFQRNDRWADTWDTQTSSLLPEAVELAFTIRQGGKESNFRTTWQVGGF